MYDSIIIGAGIAGLSSAIYASRKRMKFEIISSDIGGQFMVSGEILNYPGIVKTTGVGFSSVMEEQMKFNNVNIIKESVKKIEKLGSNFKVITDKKEYETRTVIIATGARPRKIGVPGEEEFAKKGVTYCSICDGPLFSGKDVVIIGGGDAALEAVDFLKEIVSKIYLLVRGDKFTAHEYLQERVKENSKVEILFNVETKEILGDNFVSGVKYEQDGEEKTIDVQGVIIEIGRIPNTENFEDVIKLDEHNHISIDCQTNTNVPGIFAAGDCASGHEYQYVIAAGQGCMALIKAARYLAKKKD
ncbi:thioredoxin-disulfide reductase [Candidatus Woesearchaeota archaeon B3_Woes]|nr:MAG: thioredoxin-disulfide reductase [Candidatus Woesearchaeota archaeon B3_Woes]